MNPRFDARASARPGRPVKDARREELLGRLMELILENGFSQVTLDDVAAHLRCSKSALYALASSKEQLVTTVVKRFFRDATTRVEARISTITDPSEKIATYLAAVGEEMRHMSVSCYDDIARLPVTQAIYDANSQAAAARIRQMIQDGVDKGFFRPVHGAFVGEAVALIIEGIQHGDLLKRAGLTSGDAFAELSSLVLSALANAKYDDDGAGRKLTVNDVRRDRPLEQATTRSARRDGV